MSKIVCFGELMLRLSTEGYLRFEQSNRFDATFGGGEANVAVSLAHFGMDAAFVSKFPDNPIGDMAIRALRAEGVNTESILRGGERLGIYYLEKGASQRPSKVVYDRKHSAVSEARPEEYDWSTILDGADWFHFSGITPALGDNVANAVLDALKVCREKHIPVSCDVNYRKKLWSSEKAGAIMSELCPYVDVCFAGREDATERFGIPLSEKPAADGTLTREGASEVAEKLSERFGFSKVAISKRESLSASDNTYSAMLYSKGNSVFSRQYAMHIVDRVGGGDAFAAGLIYGLQKGFDDQKAVEFAVAASCLKHSIETDFNYVSVSEVGTLMKGDSSGRVQR